MSRAQTITLVAIACNLLAAACEAEATDACACPSDDETCSYPRDATDQMRGDLYVVQSVSSALDAPHEPNGPAVVDAPGDAPDASDEDGRDGGASSSSGPLRRDISFAEDASLLITNDQTHCEDVPAPCVKIFMPVGRIIFHQTTSPGVSRLQDLDALLCDSWPFADRCRRLVGEIDVVTSIPECGDAGACAQLDVTLRLADRPRGIAIPSDVAAYGTVHIVHREAIVTKCEKKPVPPQESVLPSCGGCGCSGWGAGVTGSGVSG